MPKYNTKAGSPLRQLKRQYRQLKQQHRRLKEETNDGLLEFEHKLYEQLYAQHFFNEALLHLLHYEDNPDSQTLMGAMTVQQSLRKSGKKLTQYLNHYREQLM